MLERPLQRVTALGTREIDPPATIVESKDLRVTEEILPVICSLRTSRRRSPDLGMLLRELKLEPPKAPLDVSGDTALSCAWLEPHAWLLIRSSPWRMPAVPAGILATDVSHRFTSLRITGARAEQLLASAISVPPGALAPARCLRTRFAEEAEVLVQRFADVPGYRLLIDVSLGHFAADWLRDAAGLLQEMQ